MRLGLRTPFFGMPEDYAILGTDETIGAAEASAPAAGSSAPDPVEPASAVPLGRFSAHQGENRRTRRKAGATFAHPEASRRELMLQRRKHQRGKLDPELRRLQRKALSK